MMIDPTPKNRTMSRILADRLIETEARAAAGDTTVSIHDYIELLKSFIDFTGFGPRSQPAPQEDNQ